MLIFPELSYKILGASFNVANSLGVGLSERDYGNALSVELARQKLQFSREVFIPVEYGGKMIGRYFADFVIENKIILELKVITKLGYGHIEQLLPYLRASGLKLGILIYFTKNGVRYRRVLNPMASVSIR